VIAVNETPCFEEGRQKWLYNVEYARGNVETIELSCISNPVTFDYGELTLQQILVQQKISSFTEVF